MTSTRSVFENCQKPIYHHHHSIAMQNNRQLLHVAYARVFSNKKVKTTILSLLVMVVRYLKLVLLFVIPAIKTKQKKKKKLSSGDDRILIFMSNQVNAFIYSEVQNSHNQRFC